MSECNRPFLVANGEIPSGESALRTVAEYRLLRKIGEGGMSAVYLSYDVVDARSVAVKLLADHLAERREFVERFYREAHLSRELEHDAIVRGFASGFDVDAGKHFLVLEYIDGPTAHGALVRTGKLSVGTVVQIGIDIARALAFLHERNYVHRDVKPDNILLHPNGVAKLADLGLAKRLNDPSQPNVVQQGVGTTYYMPHEQAVNANLVDGRGDLFALGATLYHLLTGEVPFPGTTHDEVNRLKARNAFRPLRTLNPDIPTSLAQIISTMLAFRPRARFQRASELADVLVATGLATGIPPFGESDTHTTACLDPTPVMPLRPPSSTPPIQASAPAAP